MVGEYAHTPPDAAAESVASISKILRQTLRMNELDSPVYTAAVDLARRMGDPQSPSELGALVVEAEVAALNGQVSQAAGLYAKAVALDPSMPVLHQRRGSLLLDAGKIAQARKAFRTALMLNPENPEARGVLAEIKQARKPSFIAPDPADSPVLRDLIKRRKHLNFGRVKKAEKSLGDKCGPGDESGRTGPFGKGGKFGKGGFGGGFGGGRSGGGL